MGKPMTVEGSALGSKKFTFEYILFVDRILIGFLTLSIVKNIAGANVIKT